MAFLQYFFLISLHPHGKCCPMAELECFGKFNVYFIGILFCIYVLSICRTCQLLKHLKCLEGYIPVLVGYLFYLPLLLGSQAQNRQMITDIATDNP